MQARARGAVSKTADPGCAAEGEDSFASVPRAAELLAKGQDLEAEAVAGTEEGAEGGEETQEEWNHGIEYVACEPIPAPALIS